LEIGDWRLDIGNWRRGKRGKEEGMNDYKGREGESVVVRKRIKEKTQQQQQQQPSPSTARPNNSHRRCLSLPNNQHGFLFLLSPQLFYSFYHFYKHRISFFHLFNKNKSFSNLPSQCMNSTHLFQIIVSCFGIQIMEFKVAYSDFS